MSPCASWPVGACGGRQLISSYLHALIAGQLVGRVQTEDALANVRGDTAFQWVDDSGLKVCCTRISRE